MSEAEVDQAEPVSEAPAQPAPQLFLFSAESAGGFLNAALYAASADEALERLKAEDAALWGGAQVQTSARGTHAEPPAGVPETAEQGMIGFWFSDDPARPPAQPAQSAQSEQSRSEPASPDLVTLFPTPLDEEALANAARAMGATGAYAGQSDRQIEGTARATIAAVTAYVGTIAGRG